MSKSTRDLVALKCEVCRNKNYTTYKSKTFKENLEKTKYCSTCQKHTLHKETKVK